MAKWRLVDAAMLLDRVRLTTDWAAMRKLFIINNLCFTFVPSIAVARTWAAVQRL
ncbi:hypothetical protein [Cupriavidus pinatubonensis]|uniref:hypothetical protein n=1 Tax=Cupriavidus pinatubonensis TaxID=248026 RepID=UPI0015E39C18|nr:hypothetical protein [Cupriavidus pinatubonensis]